MGSDFSYADLTNRKLDHYDYKLLKRAQLDGNEIWIVEAVPNTEKEIEETGYTRSILFVRRDNNVVVRAKHWLEDGRNKYLDVGKLEKVDGIWVPTQVQMTTKKGTATVHKTITTVISVEFNQQLQPKDFTLRWLEKGR